MALVNGKDDATKTCHIYGIWTYQNEHSMHIFNSVWYTEWMMFPRAMRYAKVLCCSWSLATLKVVFSKGMVQHSFLPQPEKPRALFDLWLSYGNTALMIWRSKRKQHVLPEQKWTGNVFKFPICDRSGCSGDAGVAQQHDISCTMAHGEQPAVNIWGTRQNRYQVTHLVNHHPAPFEASPTMLPVRQTTAVPPDLSPLKKWTHLPSETTNINMYVPQPKEWVTNNSCAPVEQK